MSRTTDGAARVPRAGRRRWLAAALASLVAVSAAGCGDTGSTGSTNTQGGTSRAPLPGAQSTPRPTATTAR